MANVHTSNTRVIQHTKSFHVAKWTEKITPEIAMVQAELQNHVYEFIIISKAGITYARVWVTNQ
jgi:hypothetical protein